MNAIDPLTTQRADLAGLLRDIERLESIFLSWEETPRGVALAYRTSIEALHGEAIKRLVRALKSDPAALAAMKTALSDEIVYAVLRRHEIVKPSLNERVENALDSVRPVLASHGGDVELVSIRPPAIEVRFLGACDGCAASALTFHAGVKKAVQDACPEIEEILQVKGYAEGQGEEKVRFVSPFSLGQGGDWILASTLAEIPEAGIRAAELGGEKVILSRRGSTVSCFRNACAHLGFALDDGEVEDGIITCAWHGFRYDLLSGECLTAPEVQLQPYPVRVIGNRVEVRMTK